MNKIKHIAIIASADKKTDIIEWSYFNRKALAEHEIIALGYAANVLEGTINKPVYVLESGKLGELSELCTLIENNRIDAVIIFNDAQEFFDNKGLKNITEAAIKQNILIATNRTTADFVINSPLIENEYTISGDEKKIADRTSLTPVTAYPLAKAS